MNVRKNITDLLIVVLIIIVLLQTCGKFKKEPPIIIRDTVINTIIHDSTIIEKPTKNMSVLPEKVIEKYYYDTGKSDLRDKYIELAKKFETLNTYNQTFKIDTIGSVTIKDTVGQNQIKGRSIDYSIKEKQVFIKETIITPADKKRQVFVGGEVSGTSLGVNGAAIGLIYKDRRDNIYKASGGTNFALQPQITIGYYKPIKFK